MEESKYELKQTRDKKDWNLYKDGCESICPVMQKVLIPTQLGGVELLNFPCHILCPFFVPAEAARKSNPEIKSKGAYLRCVPAPLFIEINNIEDAKKKPETKPGSPLSIVK